VFDFHDLSLPASTDSFRGQEQVVENFFEGSFLKQATRFGSNPSTATTSGRDVEAGRDQAPQPRATATTLVVRERTPEVSTALDQPGAGLAFTR
jgi:hypothetical protein